jgi:hypothetical protein
MGHMSSVCPQLIKLPPDQIHAIATGHNDASESSEYESVLILTQFDKTLLSQSELDGRRPINSDLLLLDSQSTVHLFSRPEHANNICQATTPIRVHCNKGTLDTKQEANFGNTPVYFDARGIANVLSLYRLGKKYKVTYDSEDRGGVFKVFTTAGVVEFTPTANGLHALNLKDNPEVAYLLVNDTNPIKTVRTNYEGFTKKQIQQATTARCLMGMIQAPSERDYQGVVHLNLLKCCPITNDDIVNAHKLFGPDLTNIRGKTVRRKPERVKTDYRIYRGLRTTGV